jgi:DNA-binding transcriptional LysR family regulator
MTLDQLRIFVAAAEREHVTKAAEALNLSQSAVSSAIFLLERAYGVKLFHRVGRGIALTEAGRFFLGEARAILARTQSAEIALGEYLGLARGRLTIHASQTISSYFLPPHLARFHARFPGIELVVAAGNTAQVARAVTLGDAELGFIEGPAPDPMLAAEPVGTDEMIIVVAPGHPWAARKKPSAAELLAENWVLREDGSGTRAVFTEAMAALGIDPGKLRVALALPSNEAVRVAVESGLGATALSSLVCTDSLAAGKLIKLKTALPRREFNAVQHVEHYRSRAVAALLALIKEAAPPAQPRQLINSIDRNNRNKILYK